MQWEKRRLTFDFQMSFAELNLEAEYRGVFLKREDGEVERSNKDEKQETHHKRELCPISRNLYVLSKYTSGSVPL